MDASFPLNRAIDIKEKKAAVRVESNYSTLCICKRFFVALYNCRLDMGYFVAYQHRPRWVAGPAA